METGIESFEYGEHDEEIGSLKVAAEVDNNCGEKLGDINMLHLQRPPCVLMPGIEKKKKM